MITTTSDAEGRYRLVGVPKGNGHKLSVYPPLDRPYFITEYLKVPAGPGLGPVRFDIDAEAGDLDHRPHHRRQDRPARAGGHPLLPVPLERTRAGLPELQSRPLLYWTGNRYRTDADGRLSRRRPAGRGIVAVKSFDEAYRIGVGVDRLSRSLPSEESVATSGYRPTTR